MPATIDAYNTGFDAALNKFAKDLTTAGRERIKKKNFALPGKEKYPIHDEAHARNALARVSQFGSPAEKAQVRAKVKSKYPGIKQAAPNLEGLQVSLQNLSRNPVALRTLLGAGIGGVLGAGGPDNEDRLRGALQGAALGGGLGHISGNIAKIV